MSVTSIEWTATHVERFWRSVRKSEGCWEWTAGRFSDGMRYGQFRVGKKKLKAHRFSYMIHHGSIPDGMKVLHKCDNPICMRPDHHFLGTNADNTDDMVRKGRAKNGSKEHAYLYRGELNPAAKITAEIAGEIRRKTSEGVPRKMMVKAFGLSPTQVANIARGQSWR
jgi:hypothetical protein